jgi:hypothetical protein
MRVKATSIAIVIAALVLAVFGGRPVSEVQAASSSDVAVTVLDHAAGAALRISGAGVQIFGSVFSNSAASNSIAVISSSSGLACNGGWMTAANEAAPNIAQSPSAGLLSASGSVPGFAQPGCYSSSCNCPVPPDNPTNYVAGLLPVADPYASTSLPPSSPVGWYYTWSGNNRRGGTWATADTLSTIGGNQNYELFPGDYPHQITLSGGKIYLNPGVYTLEDGLSAVTGGSICLYGSPVCDGGISAVIPRANCSSASFGVPSTLADQWYYYCSMWGMWDSSILTTPGAPSLVAPTFSDGTPLNGVTVYLRGGNFSTNGSTATYLAAPDPCAGSGNMTSGTAVPFPAGAANASYTYPSGSLPLQDGVQLSPSGQLYPNADLQRGAECSNPPTVWSGEFGPTPSSSTVAPSQHLHFVLFTRSASSQIRWRENGSGNLFGIVYSPGTDGCGSSCATTVSGTKGGSAPTLTGQIVADTLNFEGNYRASVFYRPALCTCARSPQP